MIQVINLDDPTEVADFIKKHKTLKGIALANRLGIKGTGAKAKANSLSGYAWNKHTAIKCRERGDVQTALKYEQICERIYSNMSPDIRW